MKSRLSRLKSGQDLTPPSPISPFPTGEATLKASMDDLRSPDSREVLRQHFTGAFPESLQEWNGNGNDMSWKERLGQNDAAARSSLSVETPAGNNTRLSPVPESQQMIDIEAAILLLTELKKTASPSELVALHKALLPTRDSYIASPSPISNDERFSSASVIRRGSMQPAGFATRGGPTRDILRHPDEIKVVDKYRKTHASNAQRIKNKGSQSSLAALDLADDAHSTTHSRAKTPGEEDYTHAGHYRAGTLRVTNGAASPEPLNVTKALELNPPETVQTRAGSFDYATAPNTPLDREGFDRQSFGASLGQASHSVIDFHESADAPPESALETPRGRRSLDPAVSGIPHPLERDESVPRVYKRQWPHPSRDPSKTREPRKRRSQSLTPRSRDPSASRLPLPAEKKASIPAPGEVVRKMSEQSFKSVNISRERLDQVRSSIDDGRVSPLPDSMPRFARRWSHRASQISQEYVSDCEISASPYNDHPMSYADREALMKRLSTVYDGEDDVDETPEAALSRLNGVRTQHALTPGRPKLSASTRSPPGSASSQQRGGYFGRPIPSKQDSGYATDGSSQDQQPKTLKQINSHIKQLQLNMDEGISLDQDETASLYNLEQVLRSPSILSPLASPSPPASAPQKKHLSLLKLASSHRASSNATLQSSPLADSTTEVPPVDLKRSKSKKKLQKPMPESVKKQLKEQRKRQKEQQQQDKDLTVAPSYKESIDLPEVVTGLGRMSWEPETALPTPTPSMFQPREYFEESTPVTPAARIIESREYFVESRPAALDVTTSSGFAAPEESVSTPPSRPSRQRSKSDGRGRPRGSNARKSFEGIAQRSRSLQRHQSEEAIGRDSSTPGDFDLPVPCLSSSPKEADDEAPLWTDFSSVSRTLGSNPYDISTTMVRRTIALPGAVSNQMQSPHQISTTVVRSRTGGLQGMDSGMASELARMKSRDVAMGSKEELYDRPRMATPKKRSESIRQSAAVPRVPQTTGSRRGSSESNSQQQLAELSERPMSTYAESIPPLPELPADVRRVVSKVDIMVSKRIKDSAQPTPTHSERSSEERIGHSTLPVADAVRKALDTRNKSKDPTADDEIHDANRSFGPRQQSSSALHVQVRDMLRTPSAESITIGLGSDVGMNSEPPAVRDTQTDSVAAHWAQQAHIWKQRRKSAGEFLGKPVTLESEETPTAASSAPLDSPNIIVSRYVTPHANDIPHTSQKPRQRSLTADDQANLYRSLIEDDKENQPSSTVVSHSETATGYSTTTTTTTIIVDSSTLNNDRALLPSQQAHNPIERARSPGGRVITPSGNYHPFTPANANQAEQSRRAESVAKLAGATARRKGKSLDAPRPQLVQQRQAVHEQQYPVMARKSEEVSHGPPIDRFAGGLQFGYERGSGLGGSAGTRMKDDKAPRRSKDLSSKLGLDLSDLPALGRIS